MQNGAGQPLAAQRFVDAFEDCPIFLGFVLWFEKPAHDCFRYGDDQPWPPEMRPLYLQM